MCHPWFVMWMKTNEWMLRNIENKNRNLCVSLIHVITHLYSRIAFASRHTNAVKIQICDNVNPHIRLHWYNENENVRKTPRRKKERKKTKPKQKEKLKQKMLRKKYIRYFLGWWSPWDIIIKFIFAFVAFFAFIVAWYAERRRCEHVRHR